MEKSKSPPLTIYEAMNSIMTDLGPISKSKVNTEQNYKFRGIDAAMDALNPLLAKYWVFPTTEEIESILHETIVSRNWKQGYHIIRRYTFALNAKDGTNIKTKAEGEAIDYGDKAAGKAYSVAYRDMLYKTFVAPFEASIIDPQGSMDIEDQNHNLYDESKDQEKKKAPIKTEPKVATKPSTPSAPKAPEKKASLYGIKQNKQLWEDYWYIKMNVRIHEKNEDGTQKFTEENMWTHFSDTLTALFGKTKIEDITVTQSIQLEKILKGKLNDIIAEETSMRVRQERGETQVVQKVAQGRETVGK